MFTVRCPGCGAQSSLSFTEAIYEGPLRCWKCKGAFMVVIENGEVKSWKPLSEEELEKYIDRGEE